MKLSELLAEFEPKDVVYATEFKNVFDIWQLLHATRSKQKALDDIGRSGRIVVTVDRASYDKLKSVAIELAKALEWYNSVYKKSAFITEIGTAFSDNAITRAKEILEGKSEKK